MAVFVTRMPAGIPGDVTRFQTVGTTIDTVQIDPIAPPNEYGLGIVIDATSHGARLPTAGDLSAAIRGVNVRANPTSQNNTTDGFGVSTPPKPGDQVTLSSELMRRGYIAVKLRGVTAAVKEGAVYVWTGTAAGGHVPGGIEAAAGASGVILANSYFTGPADPGGITEVAVNI